VTGAEGQPRSARPSRTEVEDGAGGAPPGAGASELWVPVTFRGERVFARSRADGVLWLGPGGMVEFRYQPAGKSYKSRPESFERIEGEKAVALGDPTGAAKGPKAADGPGAKAASARPAAGKAGSHGRVAGRGAIVDLVGRRGADKAVQLWTDGACSGNPGPAGLGVRYEYGGEVRELSEYLGEATNNVAELTAILRGLEMVEDFATPVDVMTDSEYCLGLLGLGWKAKANQALVESLRARYQRFSDVLLVKVKGHAGVEGNERADELARSAIVNRKTTRT